MCSMDFSEPESVHENPSESRLIGRLENRARGGKAATLVFRTPKGKSRSRAHEFARSKDNGDYS